MYFYKYHGLGNDFVLTPDMDGTVETSPERARKICDRHTGIGADGWMLIRSSETCDIQMYLYNSDGSVAEMCGNGLRCFAKFVYDHKLVEKEDLTVETLAGVMHVHVTAENGEARLITANIGKPSFEKPAIPMVGAGECDREEITALDRTFTISACLMGVPHVVVFGKDFDDAQVAKYGPVLECHPAFPRKANINFANIIDEKTVMSGPGSGAAAGRSPAEPAPAPRRCCATSRATPKTRWRSDSRRAASSSASQTTVWS